MNDERWITSSVLLYRALLRLYPAPFLADWREEMLVTFRDLARYAWRTGGGIGLLRLWLRTLPDIAVSLPGAYLMTGRTPMKKLALGMGILYLVVLLGGVTYGAVGFREFREAPAFNREATPDASEDELLSAYEEALQGPYGTYRAFAAGVGYVVAVCLGVAAGLFGVWQESFWRGAMAFAGGTVVTVLSLSALPWIYFPLDQYAVPAIWLVGGPFLVAAGIWAAVIVVGRPLAVRRAGVPRTA